MRLEKYPCNETLTSVYKYSSLAITEKRKVRVLRKQSVEGDGSQTEDPEIHSDPELN